jgi:hypothetical protein
MTPQDIIAKALESSGLDRDDVESMSRFIPQRFNGFSDVWEVGQPAPAPGLVVFAIFTGPHYDPVDAHVPGDVRVYCLPAPGSASHPCCFTLNRTTPTGFQAPFASLDGDQFAETVGEEWSALSEAISLFDEDDDDSVECPACSHRTTMASEDEEGDDVPKFCGHCGAALPELAAEVLSS